MEEFNVDEEYRLKLQRAEEHFLIPKVTHLSTIITISAHWHHLVSCNDSCVFCKLEPVGRLKETIDCIMSRETKLFEFLLLDKLTKYIEAHVEKWGLRQSPWLRTDLMKLWCTSPKAFFRSSGVMTTERCFSCLINNGCPHGTVCSSTPEVFGANLF